MVDRVSMWIMMCLQCNGLFLLAASEVIKVHRLSTSDIHMVDFLSNAASLTSLCVRIKTSAGPGPGVFSIHDTCVV